MAIEDRLLAKIESRLVAPWRAIGIYGAEARRSQSRDSHEPEQPFCWGDIDRRLLDPKTDDLVEEMLKRSAALKADLNGSSAGYLTRYLDSREELADEYAERTFAAHCEAWIQQNQIISTGFIRAVWNNAVYPIFAAQKSSMVSFVAFQVLRGESVNSGAVEEWQRKMDRLANRRGRDLEAEAVAIEYAAKAEATRLELAATASELSTVSQTHLTKPSRSLNARPLSPFEKRRRSVIWMAIKLCLEGPKYCAYLESHKIVPPVSWVQDGCPRTYSAAYRLPDWARRIVKEKARMKVAMNKMARDQPHEFERIMGLREAKVS